MFAGDLLDIGARNAEVVQLTVVESGELTDGLLVGRPLLESLANAHFISPSLRSGPFPLATGGEIVLCGESEQGLIGQYSAAENA